MSEKIRTLLADDHALVVEGLRGLLDQLDDIEVIATASNGDDLLYLLSTNQVDVVVMDLQMPFQQAPNGGLSALAEIRRRNLEVHVLILTAFGDGESIQSALELAAEGFVLKTESPKQTIEAIRQVAQGRLVFPKVAQRWLMSQRKREAESQLSPREREVLEFMAKGMTNPEIAHKLSVSENTVRFHLKNIYSKLGVSNRTEAAAWYFTHNNGS
ncbi:MAG: response regulator transcription factor [Anaerolineae bacterium]|nr:response regulator transcription factor [Anaerolineae bacterium]